MNTEDISSFTKPWDPTLAEVYAGLAAVANEPIRDHYDAIFIHGAPIRSDEQDDRLLQRAADFYAQGIVGVIVLNGLTAEMCREKNLAYAGYEAWHEKLLEKGVSSDNILVMVASDHTGFESKNLLLLAQERGWTKLGILSHEHHIARCFLTIIPQMLALDFQPDVYPISGPHIDWNEPLKKPVMGGQSVAGGNVDGALPVHIGEEIARIIMYAQEPTEEKKFTRHASFPEMYEYLDQRG